MCKNNAKWKDTDLDAIKEKLKTQSPLVFDKSTEVDSENGGIEGETLFTCYYPDGATTPTTGGFEKSEDLKGYVEQMA